MDSREARSTAADHSVSIRGMIDELVYSRPPDPVAMWWVDQVSFRVTGPDPLLRLRSARERLVEFAETGSKVRAGAARGGRRKGCANDERARAVKETQREKPSWKLTTVQEKVAADHGVSLRTVQRACARERAPAGQAPTKKRVPRK